MDWLQACGAVQDLRAFDGFQARAWNETQGWQGTLSTTPTTWPRLRNFWPSAQMTLLADGPNQSQATLFRQPGVPSVRFVFLFRAKVNH